jgi:hypothetical protein
MNNMGLNPKGDGEPLGRRNVGLLLIDLKEADDYFVKV